ncbi:ABC transporter ATP-binding protein [Plantactinospora sp. WMMB782]|uniref:ABC transporter ATP-binding protein n=1 Tax=Plantactinospora sp. WMMB782 TaxID=3404121 RepID=UPI003B962395
MASVHDTRERAGLLRLLPSGGRAFTAGVVVLSVVFACVPALTALSTGGLVDALAHDDPERVAWFVGALAGLVLAGAAIGELLDLVATVLSRRIDGLVRNRVRGVARTQPIESLESVSFQDDASRSSDDGRGFGRVRSPGTAATGQLALVFQFVAAALAGAVVARFSVWLAVLLFVTACLSRRRNRRLFAAAAAVRDGQAGQERRVGYWSDLAGPAVPAELRLFGLADWVLARRRAAAIHADGPHWRAAVRIARRQTPTIAVTVVAAAVTVGAPAVAAAADAISVAEMMRYLVAAWAVYALSRVEAEAFDVEYGLGAVRALAALESRSPATAVGRAHPSPPGPTGGRPGRPPVICFDEVCFGYPADAGSAVLRGVTFTLRPGEAVAVVGVNGAGKTTLVKLLAGLYQPTSGRITVDGTDLRDLDTGGWQGRLAAVFQDFVRYPATAADNIALSAPEAVDDIQGIVDAARLADAEDLVRRLPNGLETSLWREGAHGVDLSGGQWQRIAIARALFAVAHGRRLLLLDEPTAHLDVELEAAFHARVVDAVRHRATTVLISHRLSTVRPADRILLLRDGRITESGGHDDLMALRGDYHRLFSLQAARFGDPARGESA